MLQPPWLKQLLPWVSREETSGRRPWRPAMRAMQSSGVGLWTHMILLLRRVRLWLRNPQVFQHALRHVGTHLLEQIRQQLPPEDYPLAELPSEDN